MICSWRILGVKGYDCQLHSSKGCSRCITLLRVLALLGICPIPSTFSPLSWGMQVLYPRVWGALWYSPKCEPLFENMVLLFWVFSNWFLDQAWWLIPLIWGETLLPPPPKKNPAGCSIGISKRGIHNLSHHTAALLLLRVGKDRSLFILLPFRSRLCSFIHLKHRLWFLGHMISKKALCTMLKLQYLGWGGSKGLLPTLHETCLHQH